MLLIIAADITLIVIRKTHRPQIVVNHKNVSPLSIKLDPNIASSDDLESLPGLTRKSAQAIVDYRTEFKQRFPDQTAFTCLDDFKRVPGISNKALTQAGPFLTFPSGQK